MRLDERGHLQCDPVNKKPKPRFTRELGICFKEELQTSHILFPDPESALGTPPAIQKGAGAVRKA